MIFGFGFKPDMEGLVTTVIILNVVAIPIGMTNYLLGANYMYLCNKPPVENGLLMGEWPIYIFAMEIIAILIFILLLAPFKLKKTLLKN